MHAVARPAFDASVWELLAAARRRARWCRRPATRRPGCRRPLARWLARARGSRLAFLPRRWPEALLEASGPRGWPAPAACWSPAARRCRRGRCGAARTRLPGRAAQPLRPDRDDDRRHRRRRVAGAGDAAGRRRSAGRSPTPGSTCSTRRLQPVPVGVPGELYIGGAGARPRLPRPAGADRRAVRARSVRRPSRARGSTAPATWRAGCRTASLEFLGRIDHQVKIRGFRIELGEIEARARARHPAVREAAVVVREDAPGRPAPGRLRGRGDGAAGAATSCAPRLRGELPEYMVPSAFVVARRAAAHPQRQGRPQRPARARAADAPDGAASRRRATPVEELLAGIWAEVLGARARSASHDDFFELGGHSLLATQVVSRLRAAPSASSCRCARCSRRRPWPAWPRAIEAARRPARAAPAPPLVPGAARRRRCRSPSPRSGSGSSTGSSRAAPPTTCRSALRLAGALDAGALAGAPRARSCAATRRCAPRFARGGRRAGAGDRTRRPRSPLPLVDLAALPAAGARARGAAARRRGGGAAVRPRRAARCCAPRCSGSAREEHVAPAHHAPHRHRRLVDRRAGARAGGALRRLRARRGPSPLPELPVQYADFAVWQRELARGRGAGGASSPTGASSWPALPPLLELPTDRPRPAVQTLPRRRGRRLLLGRRSTRRSRRSAGGEGATLFMTLLAAFQALLGRYTGPGPTSPSARRSPAATGAEIEGLIGFFVNTLVLRARPGGRARRFRELLGRVRETALERLRPPGPAVRAAGRGAGARSASLGHTPLFQVMLRAAERAAARRSSCPGCALRRWQLEHAATREVRPDAVALRGDGGRARRRRSSTAPTSSTPPRSSGWLGHLRALLEGVAGRPGRGRSAGRCRCSPRRSAASCWWSGTTPPRRVAGRRRPRALRGAGAPHARTRWPSSDGESALTYARARTRAPNRLAHRLRAPGRRAGGRWWALCLERSLELLVGAARRPQGGRRLRAARPRLPAERLAFMLADARRRGRCSRTATCATGCPDARRGALCLDAARTARGAEPPRRPSAVGASAGAPRLRDLHLGLDRPAQGGGDRPHRSAGRTWSRWAARSVRRRRRTSAPCSSPPSASTSRVYEICSPLLRRRARWCWSPARTRRRPARAAATLLSATG